MSTRFASTFVSGIGTHIGLTVPDLDDARRFYCDLLGFVESLTYEARGPGIDEMTGVEGGVVRTAMLEVPGGARIQMQAFDPPGETGRSSGKLNDQGITHLSFGVEDVRAEHERLTAAGVTFRNEPIALQFDDPSHPMNGFDAVYFEDPWGVPLEFVGPSPGRTPDHQERAGNDSP